MASYLDLSTICGAGYGDGLREARLGARDGEAETEEEVDVEARETGISSSGRIRTSGGAERKSGAGPTSYPGEVKMVSIMNRRMKCERGTTFMADQVSKKLAAPVPLPLVAGTSIASSKSGSGVRDVNPRS